MAEDLVGTVLAHYRLLAVLGRGGMSVVYRAVDTRLDRPVALKVMSQALSADPEFRSRFAAEAKAASAIDHVNVVPLYDFGAADGQLFIAMRLVDGTDLARELRDGPLPPRRVFVLLGQVGAALDMLHERGLVHLDVKPANVLITRAEAGGLEHVYLADFGLTRRDARGARTAAGDFLGSPAYASPEHLQGEEIGPAADLYSLTCVLFATLSGRPPFRGDVREVVAGHLGGRVPSLSAQTGLPSAIDRVVARGLAMDPAARYPTSAQLLSAARKALSWMNDPLPAAGPSPASVGPVVPAGSAAQPHAMAGAPMAGGLTAGPGGGPDEVTGPIAGLARYPPPGAAATPPVVRPDRTPIRTGRRRWWFLAGAAVILAAAVAVAVIARGGGSSAPSDPGQSPPTSGSATRSTVGITDTAEPAPGAGVAPSDPTGRTERPTGTNPADPTRPLVPPGLASELMSLTSRTEPPPGG